MGERGQAGRLRALYVCYLSVEDPLVATQVVAYLAGLAARGHQVHLLSFETARLSRARRALLRARMARSGIAWHGLRYHKRPSLPATTFDVFVGALYAAYLIRRHRLDALHARSHVPVAMALLARRAASFRMIFDIRGLMAEEYEDAGRWARGSVPYRLTKWVQRRGIDRADGIVVLTERVRDHLFGVPARRRVYVIPCCADVDAIESRMPDRERVREMLGVQGRAVLIYVGKLTGWYMEREMVQFFARARRQLAGLHFLVLTQADPAPLEGELTRLGITATEYTISRCAPDEIGCFLAAADAAVSFVRPCFSKIASSPTKIGEYLAAGLPIVCAGPVGDVDALLAQYGVGVVIGDFSTVSLDRAAELLAQLVADQDHAQRGRQAARERLSLSEVGVPAYDGLYCELAAECRTAAGSGTHRC